MDQKPTIIIHGFKTTYELNRTTGKRDRKVDWVMYSPAHAAMYTQISDRVDWLRPPAFLQSDEQGVKMAAMTHMWAQIEPAYKAWKEGKEIPIDGTALASWQLLDAGQIQAFQAVGIKTVEQVAAITDTMIGRVQLPGVRNLKEQAQAFIDAYDQNATATRLSDLEASNAALQEQLAAAMELLEEKTGGKAKKAEKEAA